MSLKISGLKKAVHRFNHRIEKQVVKPVKDMASFFHHFIHYPKTIGAATPSSPFVGKAIAKKIDEIPYKNKRILEIGAGTGVITEHLLQHLEEGDHLDVIECVPELVKELRILVNNSPKRNQVTIHEKKVEDYFPEKPYHFIISGLPLTVFHPEQVKFFYKKLETELLAKEGLFTYYEYLALPELRLCAYSLCKKLKPELYNHFRRILKTKNDYLKHKPVEHNTIWLNFTPMKIIHVKNPLSIR